jgi:hypothetical protein
MNSFFNNDNMNNPYFYNYGYQVVRYPSNQVVHNYQPTISTAPQVVNYLNSNNNLQSLYNESYNVNKNQTYLVNTNYYNNGPHQNKVQTHLVPSYQNYQTYQTYQPTQSNLISNNYNQSNCLSGNCYNNQSNQNNNYLYGYWNL